MACLFLLWCQPVCYLSYLIACPPVLLSFPPGQSFHWSCSTVWTVRQVMSRHFPGNWQRCWVDLFCFVLVRFLFGLSVFVLIGCAMCFFTDGKAERWCPIRHPNYPEQFLRQLQAGGHRHPAAGKHPEQRPGRQGPCTTHHEQSLRYTEDSVDSNTWSSLNKVASCRIAFYRPQVHVFHSLAKTVLRFLLWMGGLCLHSDNDKLSCLSACLFWVRQLKVLRGFFSV